MKVLVVPEDPTLDQYILRPLVERLFVDLGKTARVNILTNPRLPGVDQALDSATLAGIVEAYPMNELFLILVDRDGDLARAQRAAAREGEHGGKVLVCLAIEEIEVWMLALHRERLDGSWRQVRAEGHPKERSAEPFLAKHAPKGSPGGGRAWAMRDVGTGFSGLLQVCDELASLRDRIASLAAS